MKTVKYQLKFRLSLHDIILFIALTCSCLLSDHLSSVLQLKVVPANGFSGFSKSEITNSEKVDLLLLDNMTRFKEELANCSEFALELTSGANIFVNDAFSVSHKILASTVGVTRSCYASVAGFHFEEQSSLLLEIVENKNHPYIAIVHPFNT